MPNDLTERSPEFDVQRIASVIRWLQLHPVEWQTLCWLAANEGLFSQRRQPTAVLTTPQAGAHHGE